MAKNKTTERIIIILIVLLFIYFIWQKNKDSKKSINGNGDTPPTPIMGCTNNLAWNYNPNATQDDGSCALGWQGCCDQLATNYDPTCASDPGCQCSQNACNLLTGRQACCDVLATEYDATCLGDPNCSCDNAQCLTYSGNGNGNGGVRTSCCTEGSTNYDSTCPSDPFCTCDNSICQQPQSAHTCYTNCIGTGFQSIWTTEACGTGYTTNYPNANAPMCGGSGA